MTSSTENVKLGVCTVIFSGEDLGFTKGGVEVEVATTTHEVKVDQFGETPINELITGRTVTAKVPLAETTLENLVKIMPGATLVAQGGVKASGTVTFAAAPADGDKVTLDGTDYTFKTVPAAATDMAIPASANAAAIALKNKVNEFSPNLDATSSLGVVTLKSIEVGLAGNAITLAKTAADITVSGATLAGGLDATKKKVTVKTGVSTSLLDMADKLILRPVGTSGEEDFTIFRAATPGALNFAYKIDDERVFMANFKGYADTTGELFSVGDSTAAA